MITAGRSTKDAARRVAQRVRGWRLAASNALRTLPHMLAQRGMLARVRFPNLLLPAVIHVDPQRLEYVCSAPVKPSRGCALFLGGDWDLRATLIADAERENPKFVSCRELLIDALPPEQTSEYRHIVEAIGEHGSYRGCGTATEALAHMRARSEFYRRIKAGGYRSQPELGLSPYVGEIECAVDREGRLIKINAGNHRLAVARLLGLKSIPVHVATLHDSLRAQFESGNALERIRRVRGYIARLETDYGPRQEDCSPPAGRIAKT